MNLKAFHLYSTDGCHLCEQAWQLAVDIGQSEQLQVVDIVDDPALVEAYGISIPVVKRLTDNAELFWPFEREDLATFIEGNA